MVAKEGHNWILLPLPNPSKRTQPILLVKSMQHSLKGCSRGKGRNKLSWGLSDWSKRDLGDGSIGESVTTKKPKWYQTLPSQLHAVLEEYDDVFLQDLPFGLSPMRQEHQFKIDLEDKVPLVHRSLYKMNPLKLEEAKKQIQGMLENGFIRPLDSLYGAPVLFIPKKDGRALQVFGHAI